MKTFREYLREAKLNEKEVSLNESSKMNGEFEIKSDNNSISFFPSDPEDDEDESYITVNGKTYYITYDDFNNLFKYLKKVL